jgi:hypothetical protein
MLAKDELRKWRFGGEIIARGYFLASFGFDRADSRGGTNAGSGSIPTAFAVSL